MANWDFAKGYIQLMQKKVSRIIFGVKEILDNKPKKTKMFSAISLIILLAVSTLMMSCSFVSGELAYSEAYLSVRPNPIGLGQTLLVNAWTSPHAL